MNIIANVQKHNTQRNFWRT